MSVINVIICSIKPKLLLLHQVATRLLATILVNSIIYRVFELLAKEGTPKNYTGIFGYCFSKISIYLVLGADK